MTQPDIAVFKGEVYKCWSIKIKTVYKFHYLLDLVKNTEEVSQPQMTLVEGLAHVRTFFEASMIKKKR